MNNYQDLSDFVKSVSDLSESVKKGIKLSVKGNI